MLALTRRIGESLIIGDNIEVTIVDIGHNKVKLGIDAPLEIRVVRKELLKKQPKKESTDAEPDQE